MERCANSCLDVKDCRRIDCCHMCAIYVDGVCRSDGRFGFTPRYFLRAWDA